MQPVIYHITEIATFFFDFDTKKEKHGGSFVRHVGLLHMFAGAETVGQKLCQRYGIVAVGMHQIDDKIVAAEFPHDLTAYTAGRKCAGDDTVFAAADSNGGKIPLSVVNGLEEGSAFAAVGRAVGCVFDVATLIHRAIFAQQRRAYFIEIGRAHV